MESDLVAGFRRGVVDKGFENEGIGDNAHLCRQNRKAVTFAKSSQQFQLVPKRGGDHGEFSFEVCSGKYYRDVR